MWEQAYGKNIKYCAVPHLSQIIADAPNGGQQVFESDVIFPASIDTPNKNTRFKRTRKL